MKHWLTPSVRNIHCHSSHASSRFKLDDCTKTKENISNQYSYKLNVVSSNILYSVFSFILDPLLFLDLRFSLLFFLFSWAEPKITRGKGKNDFSAPFMQMCSSYFLLSLSLSLFALSKREMISSSLQFRTTRQRKKKMRCFPEFMMSAEFSALI